MAIHPYVAQFTHAFIQILVWAIIARALLTWFPIDQGSTIYQVLWRVTEPIIEPIRRVVTGGNGGGMIDFSPLIAIILLIVMGQVVLSLQAV